MKKQLKPAKKIETGKVYYAVGKKGDMNVNLCVEIIEINTGSVLCFTQRNNIPENENRQVYLPVESVKFYPMKNRYDYDVINAF